LLDKDTYKNFFTKSEKIKPVQTYYNSFFKNGDSSDHLYLCSSDDEYGYSTNKVNRVLKVLEECEITDLIDIYNNGSDCNSEDNGKLDFELDMKKEVGKNLFSYELFILRYLKNLLQYKFDLKQVEKNHSVDCKMDYELNKEVYSTTNNKINLAKRYYFYLTS